MSDLFLRRTGSPTQIQPIPLPHFYSKELTPSTTLSMSRTESAQIHPDRYPGSITLPIEIWEHAFDYLVPSSWNTEKMLKDLSRLRTCATVCRSWRARCLFHLRQYVVLEDRRQAARIAKRLSRDRRLAAAVTTVVVSKAEALGPFATSMARKLVHVRTLVLKPLSIQEDWKPKLLHADIFLHLRIAFDSVTNLYIEFNWESLFPSAVLLARFLYSLPQLSHFYCRGGLKRQDDPKDFDFNPHVVLQPSDWPLAHVDLDYAGATGVMHFLVKTSIAATLTSISAEMQALKDGKMLEAAGKVLRDLHVRFDVNSDDVLRRKRGWNEEFSRQLLQNTNLQTFTATIFLWNYHRKRLYGLRTLLSGPLPSNLREVTVIFKMDWSREEIESLLRCLNEDICAQIDELLSGPQYKMLHTVSFHIDGYVDALDLQDRSDHPTENEWKELLSPRLPRLCARGLLRTPATLYTEP
ncbi:uncharacterized protein FIBRA_04089 [Fibroporia radiculosa]|uniref:Uncharacterized protein n=1 Tax=Fibroporia radiculosa TaxID=599839 RepID=J4G6U2_9APHY|nr:uncharacterized protein FIBRA_04089 [Fibroporia radiculosa]CCM02013.1 predicted protein [Fibroporia radiculosa]